MKLLYLDCCLRGGISRTKKIADAFLEEASSRYEIERIDLEKLGFQPKLSQDVLTTDIPMEYQEASRKVADCDLLVVAAPFYDMSVPSLLRAFIERCSIAGFTFYDPSLGGGCKAKALVYLTTRGFEIEDGSELDAASSYFKALCWLWKISSFEIVSANGLDEVSPEEGEERILAAKKKAKELAKRI